MAVRTSIFSHFVGRGEQFLNNLFTAGNQGLPEVAASAARDAYFGVWTDPNGGFQAQGHILASDLSEINGEFTINATNNTGLQFDPDVAGLAGGGYVAVYSDFNADPGGDIRAVLYDSVGARRSVDFAIDGSASDDSTPSVAALADGGFVVTWTRDLGGGDLDIRAGVFNADGSPRPGPVINGVPVSNFALVDGSAGSQRRPEVAGLASGNFVVVWEDNSNHTVYFRLFNSFHTAVAAPRVPINGTGTVTMDIQVVGLADGGFAVAFTDNGWGISGTEITLQIFNFNGTARTGFIRANNAALNGIEAGDQDFPTITTLDNGMIVVGWQDEVSRIVYAQLFDAAGNAIGTNQQVGRHGIEPAFAGLSGGQMAVVQGSAIPDGAGNGTSILTSVIQFGRHLSGDTAGDVLAGLDDGLPQRFVGLHGNHTFVGGNSADEFFGGGGNNTVSYATAAAGVTANLSNASLNTGAAARDAYEGIENLTGSAFNDNLVGDIGPNVLTGGAGNDTIDGRGGNDTIVGGSGVDTAVFSGLRSAYTMTALADGVRVTGPDGADTVTGVERLAFRDVTVARPAADFSGDFLGDMLWQNDNGTPGIWLMNGTTPITTTPVGINPGPTWKVVDSGDFNGDGKSDILWQNLDGTAAIWLMNGTTVTTATTVGSNPGPAWKEIATGDFNGDGKSDMLWQNLDGTAGIWLMDGTNVLGARTVGSNPGRSWKAVDATDLNGDGRSDILWQNVDGTPGAWLMDGFAVLTATTVGTNPGADWHLI